MDIKRYRAIKRSVRKCPTGIVLFSVDEIRELLDTLDAHREFVNHLRAYMTMGMSSKFRTYYDILTAANELQDRIK
jgi:hypothetical protein